MAGSRARHRSAVAQRGFTAVENAYLFDAALSAGALRLYAALKHVSWKNDGEIPGQKELAAMIGTTDRSLRDDFKELEARGLLTVERRPGQASIVHIETPEDSSAPTQEDTSAPPRQILPHSAPARVRGEDPEDSSPSKIEGERPPHDLIYRALVRAIYSDPPPALTDREQRKIALSANSILSAGGTPADVAERAARYQRHDTYKSCALTAPALAEHWGELAPPPEPAVGETVPVHFGRDDRPRGGPCAECEIGGGRHAQGCSLATPAVFQPGFGVGR